VEEEERLFLEEVKELSHSWQFQGQILSLGSLGSRTQVYSHDWTPSIPWLPYNLGCLYVHFSWELSLVSWRKLGNFALRNQNPMPAMEAWCQRWNSSHLLLSRVSHCLDILPATDLISNTSLGFTWLQWPMCHTFSWEIFPHQLFLFSCLLLHESI
jgi:hypothetical protein